MKKIVLLLTGIIFLGLTSCTYEDDIDNLQNQINELSENQNEIENQFSTSLDSISNLLDNSADSDINAIKMSVAITLLENITRQPESAETLIALTETMYTDYTELLPFTDNTIIVRGQAVAELFQGMSRQPEAFETLDTAATQFVGPFDAEHMSDNAIINGNSRGLALDELFISVARQPEAFESLKTAATKFLGDYDPAIFSDETIEAAKAQAFNGLLEALIRQPEAEELFNEICIQFLDFSFLD